MKQKSSSFSGQSKFLVLAKLHNLVNRKAHGLISSLLFRHGLTACIARVAKIAESAGVGFNYLLSPAKEQRDVNKGRKLKTHALQAIASRANFNPSRISNSLPLRRIVLFVCRPFNSFYLPQDCDCSPIAISPFVYSF